jgi:hypothetical protein
LIFLILSGFSLAHAQWEIIFIPGLAVFGDAVGYDIEIGMMVNGASLFKAKSAFGKNFCVGITCFVAGASSANVRVASQGLAARIGFQISPFKKSELRFIPQIIFAGEHMQLLLYGNSFFDSWGFLLSPGIIIDAPLRFEDIPPKSQKILNRFRIGLEFNYNMYFHERQLNSIKFGLLLSYGFGDKQQ